MAKREEKISRKKGKGNNTSGRSLSLNFSEPTPKKKEPVKREVDWENRPLSKRQEDFCQAFVKLNNAVQAAI